MKFSILLIFLLTLNVYSVEIQSHGPGCTSSDYYALSEALRNCGNQTSADDAIHCISLKLREMTGDYWEVVSALPYAFEISVSYYQFQGICSDTYSNIGILSLRLIIWKAFQNFRNHLSIQCKGFNSSKKSEIQKMIDDCQNPDIDKEATCITTKGRNTGGFWGTFITGNPGKSNFKVYGYHDPDNNYDPCHYIRQYGIRGRTYFVWCQNCGTVPSI